MTERTLSDVALLNPDSVRELDGERMIRYVDISGVSWDDGIDEDIDPIRLADAPSRAKRGIATGDLLISTVRPGRRAFARVPESLNGEVASTGFAVVRPIASEVVPEYLWVLLRSPEFVDHLVSRQVGSNYPAVKVEDLSEFRVSLPDEDTQRAIASVVEAIDERCASSSRLVHLLDSLCAAEFSSIYDDSSSDAARERLTIADVAATQYGFTASATEEPIGPRFLRVTDINKHNWINWSEVPFCPIDKAELIKYGLKRGDLLVARMADPGKSAIIDEDDVEAVFASYLVRLSPKTMELSFFLYCFLKSWHFEKYIAANSSGSVQRNMNARVIGECEVMIPPASVLKEFRTRIDPLRQVIARRVGEMAALRSKRDEMIPTLLAEAESGSGVSL